MRQPRVAIGPKHLFCKSKWQTREAARLDAVANLAPGDFRAVRQSLYYLGAGVDNGKAVYRYKVSAESGNRVAKENLGEHFLEGTEVRKNYHKAARHSPLRAAG